MFAAASHDLPALGVKVGKPELDWAAMGKHRDDTVAANVNGVAYLFKKNKVDTFHGLGTIKGAGLVAVAGVAQANAHGEAVKLPVKQFLTEAVTFSAPFQQNGEARHVDG